MGIISTRTVGAEYSVREFYDGGVTALEVTGVRGLDVNKTFDCGQCFRFERVGNSRHESEWGGIAHGRFVSFATEGDKLYIYNATREDFDGIWKGYLGLDTDYAAAECDILSRSDSPALANAVEYGRGIRILRQEGWETLCSFIISQNNNIPRIKKIITALSERLGEEIDTSAMMCHGAQGDRGYAFPSAQTIENAGTDVLVELRTGFRAKYIYDAASRVASGELDLGDVDRTEHLDEAADMLCEIKGVGPKVAACTLLFGFGRHDAFPIDVWIKRAIEKYFPGDFDAARLGSYAGIEQQYLFYYERYLCGDNENK